jgi:hypothetical protein
MFQKVNRICRFEVLDEFPYTWMVGPLICVLYNRQASVDL